MDDPEIFSLISGPIRGEMGERTDLVEKPHCPVCGQGYAQEVRFLHYALDDWEGEPMISLGHEHAVTADLRKAIESAGMRGIAFRPMEASFNDIHFQMIEEDEEPAELPEFFQLVPEREVRAGPGWWLPGERCAKCGRVKWQDRPWTIDAVLGAGEAEGVEPRTVDRADYRGEDMFLLDDPGPPVITERFKKLLEDNGVEELEVQRAEFIDL